MNKAWGKCATPYSSGLALPLAANYKDAAHSGGQGVRSSQRTTSTGGEARTPRHSGPRLFLGDVLASTRP